MPGVLGAFAGADLAEDGLGAIPPAVVFPKMFAAAMPPLAVERVRYVGEPVAIVVAETAAQAEDAAEAVEARARRASGRIRRRARAARAHGDLGRRAGQRRPRLGGRRRAAVEAAFASAAHVARVRLARHAPRARRDGAARGDRRVGCERRSATRSSPARRAWRWCGGSSPKAVFKVPPQQAPGADLRRRRRLRHEGAALRRVRRAPVRGAARRPAGEVARLAPGELPRRHRRARRRARGRARARRRRKVSRRCACRTYVGIGAYTSTFSAIFATNNTKNCLSSVYVIPKLQIDVKMVLTNAAPLGPYRGAGRPEAIHLIERLIDRAARAMGIDRVELRRRNFIPPSAMPYRAPNAQVYDSGEFEAVMDKALALADWQGFPGAARRLRARRAPARHRARVLPRGGGRHPRRDGGSALRGRRHASRCAPARRRWGRGISPPSFRSSRRGSACRARRCASWRATATRCPPAPRASRRARS